MSHIGEKKFHTKLKQLQWNNRLNHNQKLTASTMEAETEMGESEPEEQELETMRKERSAAVVSRLVTRLRTAQNW